MWTKFLHGCLLFGRGWFYCLRGLSKLASLRGNRLLGGLAGALLLSGFSDKPEYLAGNVEAVNHTPAGLNSYYVNGYGGGNAPPFGYGGAVCCVRLPAEWRPGVVMEIKWEMDPNSDAVTPGVMSPAFSMFMNEHRKHYKRYTKLVELPPYDTGLCTLEVHFLPCAQVKVTTSCRGYPSPNSPITAPLEMVEPLTCPQ